MRSIDYLPNSLIKDRFNFGQRLLINFYIESNLRDILTYFLYSGMTIQLFTNAKMQSNAKNH